MLINGLEINRENLSDWSCHALYNIQATLVHNVGQGWGDVLEEKLLIKLISIEIKEKLLIKLISIEIKRQTRVKKINDHAEHVKELTIKNWAVIQRQSEPLKPLPRSEY